MCQVYKLPGIYGQGIEWLGSSFVSMKVARGKAHSSRGGGGELIVARGNPWPSALRDNPVI